MTRGDTYAFDVTVFDEISPTQPYKLQDGDMVYFGIMLPGQRFEDAIIKKRFLYKRDDALHNCNGWCLHYKQIRIKIRIAPEDTVDLLPGVYYYAIKIKRSRKTKQESEAISADDIPCVLEGPSYEGQPEDVQPFPPIVKDEDSETIKEPEELYPFDVATIINKTKLILND